MVSPTTPAIAVTTSYSLGDLRKSAASVATSSESQITFIAKRFTGRRNGKAYVTRVKYVCNHMVRNKLELLKVFVVDE